MSFSEVLDQWSGPNIHDLICRATAQDVDRALVHSPRDTAGLAALLSPHAADRLEDLAREAQRLTRWHFGRTIGLYAPIYISNVCAADCAYCHYARSVSDGGERRTLTLDEVRRECEALAGHGFQSVLLLTGEAPAAAPLGYIADAVSIAEEHFATVCIEMYAMDEADYALLRDRGVEGVTLYMETYDRQRYAEVHRGGRKRDFHYRLDAIERAGCARMRTLSVGALLGLSDWRVDGFLTALHARYLQRRCWQSAVSVSFPRLRHAPEGFELRHPVSDRELVQLMLALRLFLPEAGFNLSTREGAALRDNAIPLGVTMMSAGSSTRPGGYSRCADDTLEQFEVEDSRSPREVAAAIRAAGYDPVWKDFDPAFDRLPDPPKVRQGG